VELRVGGGRVGEKLPLALLGLALTGHVAHDLGGAHHAAGLVLDG
jgi:hypothetical protein